MPFHTSQPDVSVIITFHQEGLLAHKSLLSLSRCRIAAEQAGVSVEVIATLDCPDAETERVVRGYDAPGKPDVLLPLDVGDLGLARNKAIQAASGHWVLICDGDDYLSENFISRCAQAASDFGEKAILHPHLVVLFDGWNAISWQSGDDDPAFDPACLLVCNPWNSCSFARRSLYTDIPYVLARPGESGFGYEDWHWNCETLSRGHPHRIAEDTVHYVRRKAHGSLNAAHERHHALIPRTRLFGFMP
jgi:glycosyltransferase involved in cell wall biosynthesis